MQSTEDVSTVRPVDDAAQLIIELTAALHGAGAPAHRLEATVAAISQAVGVQAAVFAQPTAVFLELDGRTRLLRVEPRDVALGDLVAIYRLARDVESGRTTVAQARARLLGLARSPLRYGRLAQAAAWLGIGGGAAVFFGGGPVELLLSALLSGLIGQLPAAGGALIPLGAALAVGLVSHAVAGVVALRPDIVLLSGLIVLLPGYTLTVGLTELATRNLASGTARLAAAGVTLLQLGVGIGLAGAIASRLLPAVLPATSQVMGPTSHVLATAVAGLAFLVLFRARLHDLPAVLGIVLVAVYGTRLGGALLGPESAPFLGALAVGLVSNLHARLRDLPALVLLVPGIILLVPGSLGLRGMTALIEGGDNMLDGARMFLVGAALVAGILTANAILPPRRAL